MSEAAYAANPGKGPIARLNALSATFISIRIEFGVVRDQFVAYRCRRPPRSHAWMWARTRPCATNLANNVHTKGVFGFRD